MIVGFGGVGIVSQEERSRSPALVRAPRAYATGAEAAPGAMRFGVVRLDSGQGTLTSYLVDVYGGTVASLAATPAQTAQDALQSPASASFSRGEVVALRRVDGDWRVQKLLGTSLSNLVEPGELGVRSGSSDVIFDYTGVRDFFLANPSKTIARAVGTYGGYWVWGEFAPASLFPCRHTGAAALSTIAETINLAQRFNAPGSYSVLTTSVTWYWPTGESMTWNASSAAGFGAGDPVDGPSGFPNNYPHTTGWRFRGGVLFPPVHVTTRQMTVTSQVPVGGVAVGFAHVVVTRLYGNPTTVDGTNSISWQATADPLSFTTVMSTDYVPLALDESFATSGAIVEGTGTLTLS